MTDSKTMQIGPIQGEFDKDKIDGLLTHILGLLEDISLVEYGYIISALIGVPLKESVKFGNDVNYATEQVLSLVVKDVFEKHLKEKTETDVQNNTIN